MWIEALFFGALMTLVFVPLYGVTLIPLLAGVGVAGGWLWIGKSRPQRRSPHVMPQFQKGLGLLAVLVVLFYLGLWMFPVEMEILFSMVGLRR